MTAADLPRRHLLALVALTLVPVPLLTVGGLAAPFPELAQRALAPMLPFVVAHREAQAAPLPRGAMHAVRIRPAARENSAGAPAPERRQGLVLQPAKPRSSAALARLTASAPSARTSGSEPVSTGDEGSSPSADVSGSSREPASGSGSSPPTDVQSGPSSDPGQGVPPTEPSGKARTTPGGDDDDGGEQLRQRERRRRQR